MKISDGIFSLCDIYIYIYFLQDIVLTRFFYYYNGKEP